MPATTLTLPVDREAPARARGGLTRFLSSETLAPELLENAALLTTELVTNSVRHSALGASQFITLHCDLDDRRLLVRVTDAGGPFPLSSPREDVGGWGLLLVAEVSDRWAVHRNAPNSVWFELDR
jgi:anti-sigma regulatory factor (Ser/Thr protein kinase)